MLDHTHSAVASDLTNAIRFLVNDEFYLLYGKENSNVIRLMNVEVILFSILTLSVVFYSRA